MAGNVYSTLPGLSAYDVPNSAYLYGSGGGGVAVMPPAAGYGLSTGPARVAGQYVTTTFAQQPHYLQRLA